MRRLVAISAAVALFFLAGCNPVTSGTVMEREFDPAHTEHYTDMIYIGQTCVNIGSGTSQTRSCTPNYMYLPRTREVPDRWFLHLENCAATQDDCDHGTVQVTKGVHDEIAVGEWYAPPPEPVE